MNRYCSTGRWKKGPEGSKASTHVAVCHVAIQSAVDEAGRSVDVRPTALHAKVCNQSRNVPAGRWKKGPEGSNASTNGGLRVKAAQRVKVQRGAGRSVQKVQNASVYVIGCLVVVQVACIEAGRSAIVDEDPTALHAKVCNQPQNIPAGRRKKAPEGSNASTNLALRVKTAQSVRVQRGAGRRVQRV